MKIVSSGILSLIFASITFAQTDSSRVDSTDTTIQAVAGVDSIQTDSTAVSTTTDTISEKPAETVTPTETVVQQTPIKSDTTNKTQDTHAASSNAIEKGHAFVGIGARLGYSFGHLSSNMLTTGFGLDFFIPISRRVRFQPSICFDMSAYKYTTEDTRAFEELINNLRTDGKSEKLKTVARPNCVSFPLDFEFKITNDFRIIIGAKPSIALGKEIAINSTYEGEIVYPYTDGNGFSLYDLKLSSVLKQRFDMPLNIGIVSYDSKYAYSSLNYSFSFINVAPDGVEPMHSHRIYLYAGIHLPAKSK